MKIIAVRVIRPKDRSSQVLANVEITFDTGVKLLHMHLLKGREEGAPPLLRMPSLRSSAGSVRGVYNPTTREARAAMTKAAEEALRQAQEANVNDFTLTFEDLAPENYRTPEFSNIQIHWFDNDRPVRAFVSVLMDNCIALNRMAVVRSETTQMLTVRIPTHQIQRNRRTVGYYRIQGDAYDLLYQQVIEAYTKRPVAEKESA